MTPAETAGLLAAAAAYDQRTVGITDVAAWHKAIGHLNHTDAVTAVARYYALNRDRIMPSDVHAGVLAIRNDRATQRHSEALAIPSRFETDDDRDLRLQRGMATCRDILSPILDRLAAERTAHQAQLTEADQKLEIARIRARQIHRDRQHMERQAA